MSDTANSLEARKKRLIWRAEHRGIREMDLLVGGFARKFLSDMDAKALDEFEDLVELPDLDLYNWLIGFEEPPAHVRSETFEQLMQYNFDLKGYDG